MSKQQSRVMGWTTAAQLVLSVQGHGLRLTIAVSQSVFSTEWGLVALEIPGDATTTEQILDAHAHRVLPVQRDVASAIQFAERYAKAWQRNRETAYERCTCTEIGKAKEATP